MRPRIHYINTYAEPWLDRCLRGDGVSQAHLWGAEALMAAGFQLELVRTPDRKPILRLARWLADASGGRLGNLDADLLVLWRARNGDIVYVASGNLLLTPLAARCGLLRVRVVSWLYKPPLPFSWRSFRGLGALRWVLAGYAGWLALTPRVESWLSQHQPQARVRRIVWSSDTDYYPPVSGLGEYFVATGVTQRDYDVLLAAARAVPFPFVILGPSGLAAQAPPNVAWRSRGSSQPHATIDDDELRKLYHGARAVLIPLRPDPEDPSGFTNLLEAMACGRPVVMTRTGALDVTPGTLGIGFDVAPGDTAGWIAALNALATEPQTALAFGARAAQLARDYFNLPRFGKDVVSYFTDLVENNPEPPPESPLLKLPANRPQATASLRQP